MSTPNPTLTVEGTIHFRRAGRGARKELHAGAAQANPEPGRVPRVSRLMALALKFDSLIRAGAVSDYAELARLGHVTRARMSQLMSLLNLATDIQQQLLFLGRVEHGRDPVVLRDLLPVAAVADWKAQRRAWAQLLTRSGLPAAGVES